MSNGPVERVLFVAPRMEVRGTSEYVLHLAGALRRRGVDVAVFCAPGPMLEVLREQDIPCETFNRLGTMWFRHGEQARFLEQLSDFAPQIIHAQTVGVALQLKRLDPPLAAPVALTAHAVAEGGRKLRSAAGQVAGLIATTQAVRQELVNKLRVDKSKIRVIQNGIDADALADREIRGIFTSGATVVGSVGPVERARGQELFVRAASRVDRAGRNVRFVVAGEGKGLPKVRALARELGLDGCLTFVGDFSSYSEVLEALDVMVQSSQVDVSGFSILGAMGHGRPVIAFNTGTACELIDDGKTGILVPLEDVDGLIVAIERLIGNPELARSMGQRARQVVADRFNINRVAQETLEFYAQLLSG